MRRIFADTFYWVALIDQNDSGYISALEARERYRSIPFVTTEAILIEFLNFFSERSDFWRRRVVGAVRAILNNEMITVIPHGDTTLQHALDLYASRMDKGYSLTDCISMLCMRREGIFEVLTADDHFAQEGFVPLLRGNK